MIGIILRFLAYCTITEKAGAIRVGGASFAVRALRAPPAAVNVCFLPILYAVGAGIDVDIIYIHPRLAAGAPSASGRAAHDDVYAAALLRGDARVGIVLAVDEIPEVYG